MKSLLPLKLLSPTAPGVDQWPKSAPSSRVTFGSGSFLHDVEWSLNLEDRSSGYSGNTKVAIGVCHRDRPIHTNSESAPPCQAYLLDEDTSFNYPPSASSYDDYCVTEEHDIDTSSIRRIKTTKLKVSGGMTALSACIY